MKISMKKIKTAVVVLGIVIIGILFCLGLLLLKSAIINSL
jgi:hypothetical protein